MKFEEIKRILEKKGLLLSATQEGEPYEIRGFRTMRFQSDWQFLLEVVRDEFWEDSCSFMVTQKLPRPIYLQILARYQSGMPFQLFIVSDIDAAEKAVRECLEGKHEELKSAPRLKTLADIQDVPEDQWVERHDMGGRCLFCGKQLEVASWSPCFSYKVCGCEGGKLAEKHNKRASKIFSKRNKA